MQSGLQGSQLLSIASNKGLPHHNGPTAQPVPCREEAGSLHPLREGDHLACGPLLPEFSDHRRTLPDSVYLLQVALSVNVSVALTSIQRCQVPPRLLGCECLGCGCGCGREREREHALCDRLIPVPPRLPIAVLPKVACGRRLTGQTLPPQKCLLFSAQVLILPPSTA